ncbi:MAG: hypothetical protein FWC61_03160 [Proteobacteria bacterium]|nr:hypothetical protein [Pseudomonadota bacterium]
MRLVLMGTPEFVVPIFDKIASEHTIAAVFTRPPKPFGRKQELQKSPVHIWAAGRGFPIETDINKIHGYNADMAIVISYGAILKKDVLEKMPFVNTHFSLLPKYRGASPFQTAIMNGDTESGVCLMRIAEKLDTGDIYMCRKFPIGENDNTAAVLARAAGMTTEMLLEFLSAPEKYPPQSQVGGPTFTRKFTGDDELIDWNKPPQEIHNLVRAIGGRTKINGTEVKILETRIINNELQITKIQPAGKKPMDWKSFVNGQRGAPIKFGE